MPTADSAASDRQREQDQRSRRAGRATSRRRTARRSRRRTGRSRSPRRRSSTIATPIGGQPRRARPTRAGKPPRSPSRPRRPRPRPTPSPRTGSAGRRRAAAAGSASGQRSRRRGRQPRPRAASSVAARIGAVRRRAGLVARGSSAPMAAASSPMPPARPALVLGAVLAGIGVFLRVDRPVRAARGAVPRAAGPVRLERLVLGRVVRRRAGRRLVRRPLPAARPGGAARRRRPAAPARRGRGRRPAPRIGPRRVARARSGSARHGSRGVGPGAVAGRAAGPARSRDADQRLVRGLDREESGKGLLPGGVGVVGLGQAAVGAPDVVGRGAGRQAERAVRVGLVRHDRKCGAGRPRRRSDRRRAQPRPSSSPSGARSKLGIASAPSRPCGSWIAGR